MKLSIITITYNSEAYLEQTIISVLNQNFDSVEYIIIDGGSTDGTLDIIKKYEKGITKWISEPDNGISDAFNKGIKMAKGEWIGIINSDDWYEDNIFSVVAKYFDNADILYGNQQYWKNNEKDFVFSANHELLKNEMTINHASTFVKRTCFEQAGLFRLEMKYAMDYELFLRLYLQGFNFVYIPNVFANMRYDGVSDTNWKRAIYESFLAKNLNQLPRFRSQLYFIKQILRTSVSRFLLRYKLKLVVEWYRKNFALLKKNV